MILARRSTSERSDSDPLDFTLSSPADRPDQPASLKLTFPETKPGPIDGYEIISLIHEGGQGVVYKALQTTTKRTVAIKWLKSGAHASTKQRRRFDREVKLSASLKHPNIVTIYDSGTTSRGDYFTMEYIRGRPLDKYVSEKNVDHGACLRLLAKIADTVDYAHRHGILHRDLKPANILVDADGQPHVLDFGLAKAAGADLFEDGRLTVTSEFMGTLAYASPEQTRGDPSLVDIRADVYALGVILYRLLTGRFPYDVSADLKTMFNNITDAQAPPPSSVEPGLSADLDTIVLKALTKDPGRRYQTAGEFGRDIERFLNDETIEARRDSAVYVLRTRYRALTRSHRVVATTAVVLLAALFAQRVGVPIVFRWTPTNAWFEELTTHTTAFSPHVDAFKDVAVITLTDDTDPTRIAHEQGLPGVDARIPKSLRRLHGRLMEILAPANTRAVAWAITFRGQTEYDPHFVRGAEALRQAGADVTVTLKTWALDEDGMPDVSATIAPTVQWGVASGTLNVDDPWRMNITKKRGLSPPRLSFALAAVASFNHPGTNASLVLNRKSESLDVLHWKRDSFQRRARKPVGEPKRIVLSAVREEEIANRDFGVQAGDLMGDVLVNIPPDEVLRDSSIDYRDVFSATPEQLRRRFNGKLVIVGDIRRQVIPREHPDGRRIHDLYAQASVIDTLMRSMSVRLPRRSHTFALNTIAAALGIVVIRRTDARIRARITYIIGVGLTATLASAVAYSLFQYMCNPAVPLIAFLTAAALSKTMNWEQRPTDSSQQLLDGSS